MLTIGGQYGRDFLTQGPVIHGIKKFTHQNNTPIIHENVLFYDGVDGVRGVERHAKTRG